MKNIAILTIPTLTTYLLEINWEIFGIFLFLVILDIITGCISAMRNGKWKSSDMRKGLYKKLGEVIVLITILVAQRMIQLNGIHSPPVFEIFVTALGFKEIGSIVENQIKLGVKLPVQILKWFKITEENVMEISNKTIAKGNEKK